MARLGFSWLAWASPGSPGVLLVLLFSWLAWASLGFPGSPLPKLVLGRGARGEGQSLQVRIGGRSPIGAPAKISPRPDVMHSRTSNALAKAPLPCQRACPSPPAPLPQQAAGEGCQDENKIVASGNTHVVPVTNTSPITNQHSSIVNRQ